MKERGVIISFLKAYSDFRGLQIMYSVGIHNFTEPIVKKVFYLVQLLDKDAQTRLGGAECMYGDVRDQDFFRPIHWDRLERRELEAPFKPRVVSKFRVTYNISIKPNQHL